MKPEDYINIFKRVAEKKEWEVNPDNDLLLSFAEGLIINREKHGMPLCPCRLATGKKEVDRLITCPCVYAPKDIKEYNRCYCGLYVSKNYEEKKDVATPIPDAHFKHYLD